MDFPEVKKNLWMISDEGIYLKKGKLGYDIINSAKKDINKPFERGNINWKHTLIISWGNLITTIIILLLLWLLMFGYKHDVEECHKMLENPYDYFGCEPEDNFWNIPNLTDLKIRGGDNNDGGGTN